MNTTLVLRDNVARLMEQRGWNQQALARKSQVSQSRIAYLLKYRDKQDRHPSTDTVDRLAGAFGMPAWQLMCPPNEQLAVLPIDEELLANTIRVAADALRARSPLANDALLARVASLLYEKVSIGAQWDRAVNEVTAQLTSLGADFASLSGSGPRRGRRDGRDGKGSLARNRKRAT